MSEPAQGKPAQTDLDLEALADKVYRLMMTDLRLSKQRGTMSAPTLTQQLGTRTRRK